MASEKRFGSYIGVRKLSKSSCLGARTAHKIYRVEKVFVSASLDEEHSSKDDYEKFSEKLGAAPSGKFAGGANSTLREERVANESNATSESYTEFSEMLGLENGKPAKQGGRGHKSISSYQPRRAEIDPRDYQVFDSLLQKSGGTGRKPMKSPKRYMAPQDFLGRKRNEKRAMLNEDEDIVQLDNLDNSEAEQSENIRGSRYLNAEETEQAYAIMMEEFGASMHNTGVEVLTDDDDELEVPNETIKLVEPPKRPELNTESEYGSIAAGSKDSNKSSTEAKEESGPAALLNPPVRPKDRTASEQRIKVTQSYYSETNEIRAEAEPEQFLPEPLLPKPTLPHKKANSVSPITTDDPKNEDREATKEEQSLAKSLLPRPVSASQSRGITQAKTNVEDEIAEPGENAIGIAEEAGEENPTMALLPKPQIQGKEPEVTGMSVQLEEKSQPRLYRGIDEAKEDSASKLSGGLGASRSIKNDEVDEKGVELKTRPVRGKYIQSVGSEGKGTGRNRDGWRRRAPLEPDSKKKFREMAWKGRSLQDLEAIVLKNPMLVFESDANDLSEYTGIGEDGTFEITARKAQ